MGGWASDPLYLLKSNVQITSKTLNQAGPVKYQATQRSSSWHLNVTADHDDGFRITQHFNNA